MPNATIFEKAFYIGINLEGILYGESGDIYISSHVVSPVTCQVSNWSSTSRPCESSWLAEDSPMIRTRFMQSSAL